MSSPRRWLPLALLLLVFAGTLLVLERCRVLLFGSLTPFVLVALLPMLWWIHVRGRADLGRRRALLVALTRMTLLALLIAALAEPRMVRADDRLTIVFAVDHSASIQEAAGDAVLRYVLAAAAAKPEQDEAGLVFFGRDAAVELPPAMSLPFETINVAVDKDGTDIAGALSLSAALLPAERPGRIVLLSDGVATEGSLPAALDELAARGVPVDVLPIEYTTEHEVWLDKLELPLTVKIGETMEPAVVLESLAAGDGVLTLEEQGKVVAERAVQFAPGRNRFSLPMTIAAPGYHELTARIRVPEGHDRFARNNVALSAVHLAGKGKVLLVVGQGADAGDHAHLQAALAAAQRDVEVIAGESLPRDPLRLLPYDCIVFVNVPREALDDVQMQAAHDAVFHQGSGFLMLGGQNGFGPGGYSHTSIEELLPVSMDLAQKKVMPKAALAIVLHTCEFPQGNTWAKRITLQAIKVLQPRDEVGVLAYDFKGADQWLFPLTPAAEYDRLAPLVNKAQIGDMPGFGTTMQMALQGLTASDAATKHVIIISDGDPAAPPPALIAAYRSAKISVSTVTVFPHGNIELQTMSLIAQATGGRHYQPASPETLPAIFIKEAKTLRRSAIENRTFTPLLEVPSRIMEGIAQLPPLHGYVLTTPKSRALTILEGPDPDEQDPVLVRWRYGIGVAAAFTSDLGSNWGKDWVAWEHYRAFVSQLITDLSRTAQEHHLDARSQAVQGEGWIVVEDRGEREELLDLQAVVSGPGGERIVHLEQVAPRRYQARFPLQGVGRYRGVVTAAGLEERAFTGFALPFSQEYLRFRSDPLVLEQIARRTGGRVLHGDEAQRLYHEPRVAQLSSRPVADWLLALLVVLLPLEVAFRRLHVDVAAWRQRLRRRPASQLTLETLLQRKQALAAERASTQERAPRIDATGATPPAAAAPAAPIAAAPSAVPPPSAMPPTDVPTSNVPQSTTGRLLAAKRRAQQRGPEPSSSTEPPTPRPPKPPSQESEPS